MRHGWKTRIDERKYFENKKAEREEKQRILEFMREKLEDQWEMARKQVLLSERDVH